MNKEKPLNPEIMRNIEKLLNDKKKEYNIPNNIRFYIVDNRETQEQNIVNAISYLLIGKRIRSTDVYNTILREIHAICDIGVVT